MGAAKQLDSTRRPLIYTYTVCVKRSLLELQQYDVCMCSGLVNLSRRYISQSDACTIVLYVDYTINSNISAALLFPRIRSLFTTLIPLTLSSHWSHHIYYYCYCYSTVDYECIHIPTHSSFFVLAPLTCLVFWLSCLSCLSCLWFVLQSRMAANCEGVSECGYCNVY